MEDNTTLYSDINEQNTNNLMILTIFDGQEDPIKIDLLAINKKKVTFGRNPENDIIIKSGIVSNFHGYFIIENGMCEIVDNSSSNGIFHDFKRISSKVLVDGDTVKIDDIYNPLKKGVVLMFSTQEENKEWIHFELTNKPLITIGRSTNCDITLKHISVSKLHAKIVWEEGNYYLYDTDSTNGVNVNGKLIVKRHLLKEKDLIIITNTKLIFTSKRISYTGKTNGVSVDAIDIVKTVKIKREPVNITNHISLKIKPSEFVAIVGGSGSGKTTFMNCISGYNKANNGEVLVNGIDLYQNYEVLKCVIGYVPQQDIVYDNLTLHSMLDYTAKLRMPKDTTTEERMKQVKEVIKMVDLIGNEDTYIKSLSGGQKKRASIAVELLSDPSLFFLDEPSSGLDPGTERNLMNTLKKMTVAGKTIILVTHSTLNLQLCDRIIFLGKGGNLCFYGKPSEALTFFGVNDYADVYNLLAVDSEKWKDRYYNSEFYHPNSLSNGNQDYTKNKKNRKRSVISQTNILIKRYFRLLLNDRQRMLMLLLQTPLLALLISIVADGNQFKQFEMTKSILFALSCSAFWIGISNSIQEICKEKVILKREYMTGLKLRAYINSKFIVLGALCFIQALLLTGVFSLMVGSPENIILFPSFISMLVTTFLTAFSATGLGLLVSSLFKNADRAMTVAPILLMPQILFSGLVFALSGVSEKVSFIVNCRWAMEGYGTIANLNSLPLKLQSEIPTLEHKIEDFYIYTSQHLVSSWGVLIGFTVVFAILCLISIRKIQK